MSLRTVYVTAGILLGLMAALSAWGLAQVGADAVVPIHWGVTGEADGYAPSLWAFLMIPVLSLGLAVLLAVIPRIEPRRANLERSAPAYRTVVIALLVFMGALHLVVVLSGTGHRVPVGGLVGGGAGVMFVIIGNVLTTVRSNFMFGVRTPWTLSSDRSWDLTHRLVGRLFVVGGLALAILSVTGEMTLLLMAMVAFIVVAMVIAFGYSYRVWKADPDRRPIGDGS